MEPKEFDKQEFQLKELREMRAELFRVRLNIEAHLKMDIDTQSRKNFEYYWDSITKAINILEKLIYEDGGIHRT